MALYTVLFAALACCSARGISAIAGDTVPGGSSSLDLTSVTITVPSSPGRATIYAETLRDEVWKRCALRWQIKAAGDLSSTSHGAESIELSILPGLASEGFSIISASQQPHGTSPAVRIIGNDERGLLFGVGRLLRLLDLRFNEGYKRPSPSSNATLPTGLKLSSAPDYKVRGHQLGYRPKTNAYDAWDVATYEQYIVDLSLFGTNLIELIPWKTDDVEYSPMFPATPQETLAGVSAVLDKYGIDCGLWYPMMFKNYSDPATMAKAVAEWHDVFSILTRLDEVQIPAGDPGSHPPAVLLGVAKQMAQVMRQYFPNATIWVGPQEWSLSEMDEWHKLVSSPELTWMDGIIYGPHTLFDLPTFWQRQPRRYPIRLYPDITHSLTTQYPVPEWDRAFVVTESRETINPRPTQYATIAALHLNWTMGVGFSSYSEGANDDFNKMLWSLAAWGPDDDETNFDAAERAVHDYARVFVGAAYEDDAAAGLTGLEQNWMGPLRKNTGVMQTLAHFESIERSMGARQALSWRLQQLRYRAYYDALLQARLLRQLDVEESVLEGLRTACAKGGNPRELASQASFALNQSIAANATGMDELRFLLQVHSLAGQLFNSIKMQLSVTQYFAEYTVRGANLDTAHLPLSNAPWLIDELERVIHMATDTERWATLQNLTNFANPGPGGFYDDLGEPSMQPHLVVPKPWASDPDYYYNPVNANAIVKDVKWDDRHNKPSPSLPVQPVAWQSVVNTFYGAPLQLAYPSVQKGGLYEVVVVYNRPTVYAQEESQLASTPPPLVRLTANGFEVHPPHAPALPVQRERFSVPPAALSNTSSLLLEFTMPGDVGGSGTGCYVAEVMLRPMTTTII